MNKVILLGHLGADPESRYLESGKSVTEFPLATNEKWKDANGQEQKNTEWHRCVVWGKMGETIAQYFKKGNQILIGGKIQYKTYEKDGIKRTAASVIVQHFEFCGSSSSSGNNSVETLPDPPEIDDLPF